MVDVLAEAKVQRSRQEALGAALDEAEAEEFDAIEAAIRIFGDDLYDPEAARAEGLRLKDAALDAMEDSNPDWHKEARVAIADVAKARSEFTADAVWALLDRRGIADPNDRRAMSAPMRWARQAGYIEDTGRTEVSTRPICHGRKNPVYKSLVREQ